MWDASVLFVTFYLFQILHEGVSCARDRGDAQHGGGGAHGQVQLGQGERGPQQHPHQCPGRYAG